MHHTSIQLNSALEIFGFDNDEVGPFLGRKIALLISLQFFFRRSVGTLKKDGVSFNIGI